MSDRFFTDETIKKHIAKYGRDCYIQEIKKRLKKGEEDYEMRRRKHLHILERIEANFE